jgi:hypothetical protein
MPRPLSTRVASSLACLLWISATLAIAAEDATDAYVKSDNNRWTLGNARIERVMALEDGKFLLKSLRNRLSGQEMADLQAPSDEFFFSLDDGKTVVRGSSGGWTLVSSNTARLKQGETQLDVTLRRDPFEITRSYVVYPGSSIIREWSCIKNVGTTPQTLDEIGFLKLAAKLGKPEAVDFHWMTGGASVPGSWTLITESLPKVGQVREFKGTDPFPIAALKPEVRNQIVANQGIEVKILLNREPCWPADGTWAKWDGKAEDIPFDISREIRPGDTLAFLCRRAPGAKSDPKRFHILFDPSIAYEGGQTHLHSKEFGDLQAAKGWSYQRLVNGTWQDLAWQPVARSWYHNDAGPIKRGGIGVKSIMILDPRDVLALIWTAKTGGRIRASGSFAYCRANYRWFIGKSTGGGSSAYAPWQAFWNKDRHEGFFLGWDFFGVFNSTLSTSPSGTLTLGLHTDNQNLTLPPGETIETPRAFTGFYRGDLDDAGNECLNWQYRYLWDYTRDGWFPAIRMLGSHWQKGATWDTNGWLGGDPDQASMYRKIFRTADLMRYVGADVHHRDWGWWDRAGDWNGPDFRSTGEYLLKSGIGQLIYAFLYTVSPDSNLIKTHPEWAPANGGFDMARPDVQTMMNRHLDSFRQRWGTFEWRTDGGWSPNKLKQDQGFRHVIRSFLDKYPDCAFQACNGGGNKVGYDYVRYASCISFSDGGVGILRNYFASLLLPPDKSSDIPDRYDPNTFDKATWRGLLCINFDMTGDTWDPTRLEGLRELIDIYHYLHQQGVVGRWVQVYRPQVTGDDPTLYFQRLSRDRLRGIIIPKQPAPRAIIIKPKGLKPDETYSVTFHESDVQQTRRGDDLMQQGIRLDKMLPGELIYLNLPFHPGNKLDKTPPAAPSDATLQTAENMGYPGVELSWKPGSDDHWVSYYDIFRNGRWLDRVAKGTYYFDHSAGADLAAKYEVATVDGAGNASPKITAVGPAAQPARLVDDLSTDVVYTGQWKREDSLMPAHAGSLSTSSEAGATASLAFEGRRLLWFSKLGDNAGQVLVSVDNDPAETIDTYSADDIWGVCVYRKAFPSSGPHTVKITVLGQHGSRSKGDAISIDGFRIER